MKIFKSRQTNLELPVFFPDATKGVVRTIDSVDIKNTKTLGLLVNTLHLYKELGEEVIKNHKGIGNFMAWKGGLISDSGGFQIMTLIKRDKKGWVDDEGVQFYSVGTKKIQFSPEESIRFQLVLKPDMVVVLDDFTPLGADYEEARETVERTVLWAKRGKEEFRKICEKEKIKDPPYLMAVVQGGDYLDLRKECAERLLAIGFNGLGYGGWPITPDGKFNYTVAKLIADLAPDNYFLYGFGIGKPGDIVGCAKLGYDIFDCVLPTRDARHKRLYVYEADSISEIDLEKEIFYLSYTPNKEKYYNDTEPVSRACDCLLCLNYSRAYLAHLFRIKELSAMRLATIHNLRFYSLLMEKIRSRK